MDRVFASQRSSPPPGTSSLSQSSLSPAPPPPASPPSAPLSPAAAPKTVAPPPVLDMVEAEITLAAMIRPEHEWMAKFPDYIRPDIQFLLKHPSGQNLKTHHCMGVAHTETFKTADHTRVTPHTLLAAEIALEMANQLKLGLNDTKDLVAAVAGHDQGHIFASHESEIAINTFPEFDGTPGRPRFCHERRTRELFESDDFARHFGHERAERIKTILYDPSHPLHVLVDWSDRLAYLIADSFHLGHHDIMAISHVRQDFVESLVILQDGSIGFSSLEAVQSLISARDLLYRRVSIGHASTLFTGFLTEAFHRAVVLHKTTPTEFVRLISDRTTPEARKLFAPQDIPRLYCPQQDPEQAEPVDLNYQAICHIRLDMLSPKGREWALTTPPVAPERTVPACSQPRAGMSKIEHHIRSFYAQHGGKGYLDRIGAIVGTAHMPPKHYALRTTNSQGEVCCIEQCGLEKWDLFIAIPHDLEGMRSALHRDICRALVDADLILPSALSHLEQAPPADFFTRY